MSSHRTWLTSPATPALLLLFGLVFGFAVFHLAGWQWSPLVTRFYYLGLFLWGVVLCLGRSSSLRRMGVVDALFLLFLGLVVVSLAAQYASNPAAAYYAKLLPFLVLLPYCLGRLVASSDFNVMVSFLPWLGLMILLLCGLDYWWITSAEIVYSRVRFFGIDHSPLLIALLVSAALLASAYSLTRSDSGKPETFMRMVIGWGGFGIMAMASVIIAARGALLACALALILMLLRVHCARWRKTQILVCFAGAIAIGFFLLPAPQAQLYGRLGSLAESTPSALSSGASAKLSAVDAERCKPFAEGLNSVVIRRIFLQEAVVLSFQNPLTGVGAGNFGKYSCGGVGAYPHSTVLQAFAELGFVGGGLFLALISASAAALLRASMANRPEAPEFVFWLSLLSFFVLTDQIYGNYFMAVGSFFLFGVAARLHVRSNVSPT